MCDERKELLSEKVVAGSRTYFFDVKESKDGTRYLVISELRQAGADYERHRVMIFEENAAAFLAGLDEVVAFLGIKHKSYNVDEVRQQHPKAYEKWSSNEDEELRKKYNEGMGISELASFFQRQPGAIQSRLAKLGLTKDAA
jgi:DNA-directed RNA polymerase specialized sigma24 family protein